MFGIKRRKLAIAKAAYEEVCRKEREYQERLRKIENSLTAEQRNWAYAYAAALGWQSQAPCFVWSEIFQQASKQFNQPETRH